MWNQVTSPFRDVDPFEKIKIPADLKNVDLNKELKNVDLKASIQSFSVPDFKSITVPISRVSLYPISRISTLRNIQFPTPPARPEAPGVILPDGARMKTLFDIFGKPDVSQWKLSSSFSLPAILEALRVSEFGAWYLAGFLLVAWQIQAQTTQELYEEKLTRGGNKRLVKRPKRPVSRPRVPLLTKQLATSGPKR